MRLFKHSRFWFIISMLFLLAMYVAIINESIDIHHSRIAMHTVTDEQFKYNITLSSNNFYRIDLYVDIGDCNGETKLKSQVVMFFSEKVVYNETKVAHDSANECDFRDPEDPSQVGSRFRYDTNRLTTDTNLMIVGNILENTKNYQKFELEILENYEESEISYVMYVMMFIVTLVISMSLSIFKDPFWSSTKTKEKNGT